jgi:hypothetical protein
MQRSGIRGFVFIAYTTIRLQRFPVFRFAAYDYYDYFGKFAFGFVGEEGTGALLGRGAPLGPIGALAAFPVVGDMGLVFGGVAFPCGLLFVLL